jgi:hypothetical protein
MWQTLALVVIAAAAGASLAWSWRLSVQLDGRERELHELREAALRRETAPAPSPAAAPAPAAGGDDEPMDRWLDELDRRRSTFATAIATRVVAKREHRGTEPFVLVVEVVLMNRGERDVRLSLRTRENENPLTVRRYLGQPDKLYSAPQAVPVSAGVSDAERGQRAQVVDEVPADDAKGTSAAVVWSRHKHVVVG